MSLVSSSTFIGIAVGLAGSLANSMKFTAEKLSLYVVQTLIWNLNVLPIESAGNEVTVS